MHINLNIKVVVFGKRNIYSLELISNLLLYFVSCFSPLQFGEMEV